MLEKIKLKLKKKELLKYIFWKIGLIKIYDFFRDPKYYFKILFFLILLVFVSKKNTNRYINLKFELLKNKKSDIYQHMDTLYEYSMKCESIFETGVRGVISSWALLKGLNDNNGTNNELLMNDIEMCEFKEIETLSINAGIKYSFVHKDNLKLNLDRNFDLTFIDTWHVYGQLKRELAKFSRTTNKYIILHDTTVDGEFGESIRLSLDSKKQSKITGYSVQEIEKGLWPAVEEFLKSSSDWILEKRYTNCNGLTILRKADIESSILT
tara:strand:- start:432 stop:1232 length:801 start_codon:yes stop_codon:yes gene_type:complete